MALGGDPDCFPARGLEVPSAQVTLSSPHGLKGSAPLSGKYPPGRNIDLVNVHP